MIVSNWGFDPSDNALYKLGLLSPVSWAIFDIPIDYYTPRNLNNKISLIKTIKFTQDEKDMKEIQHCIQSLGGH